MLSSDILEHQFGETKLTILQQDATRRIIETVAMKDGRVLELSIVTFDQENMNTFPKVHQAVIQGESMGKAYREAGITFTRQVRSMSRHRLPNELVPEFSQEGLATIIDVDILIGEGQLHYCHILEIYNPIVKWPKAV